MSAYFEVAYRRHEVRMRKRWNRIRRIGEGRFIAAFILGFWLLMVPLFFVAAWNVDPTLRVLHRLPKRFFAEVLVWVFFSSVGLYFGVRFAWRLKEQKYGRDDLDRR